MYLIRELLVIIFAIILVSCSQIQTKIDLAKNYKLDIKIDNRGILGTGMLVLPKKPLYTIQFETENKINFISFRTCSRETTQEDPSVHLNRRKYSINYEPNEIELAGNCDTVVSAFGEKGMYSVGFISYEHPSIILPAENICGEKTEKTIGVSVCQERVSSIERIRFQEEVLTSPDVGCELESVRGTEFTYKIKDGYCVYAFISVKNPDRIHRLTTYGYSEIQVRR